MGDESTATNANEPSLWFLIVTGLVVVVIAAAGFLVGRSGGEDLDAERVSGAAAGASRGQVAGTKSGKALGVEETFPAAYKRGYTVAYKQPFSSEGLDVPKKVTVKVPAP